MTPRARAAEFCARYGLQAPVLMGPMAGSSPPALAAAIADAGGMGGCGAVLMEPAAIARWVADFRAVSAGAVQVNLWVPDPAPAVAPAAVERMRGLLAARGAAMGWTAPMPDFAAQCEAVVVARPTAASSIMGLFPPAMVAALHAAGIAWFACVTSVDEADAAVAAGADALVVSGVEAGGHRGSFSPDAATRQGGTLFALLPVIADRVAVPLIAAGGIADGRGLAAALALGASAVQVGTAFLRTPEAATPRPWAEALARTRPEDTVQTRAYSGRLARAVRTGWTDAVGEDALPYPVQRAAVAPLRAQALAAGDVDAMQMWAGQAASLARADPADALVVRWWDEAQGLSP